MTNRHDSLFAARILAFASVFAVIQLFLEYARTNQTSILSVGLGLLDGILLGSVLGFIFLRLPYNLRTRVGMGWPALFIIQEFSNTVEALFFTTYLPTIDFFLASSLLGLLVTLIEAATAGILFIPQKPLHSFTGEMRSYLGQRPYGSWVLRFSVGSLAYFPIYFTFGALISPFVLPYYLDSAMGLRIPSFTVMIPLEFFRGFLYVLALFPILAGLRTRKRQTFLATASLLYVAGALVSFLTVSGFPIQLRIFHGVEILADCLAYAAVLVYLFAPKLRK